MSRHSTLAAGLAALAKSTVLVIGVPLALWRLWFLARVPSHLSLAAVAATGTWSRLCVGVVGVLWSVAVGDLVVQLAGALRRGAPVEAVSWSARWAVAIAALVALVSVPSIASPSRPVRVGVVAAAPARRVATAGNLRAGAVTVEAGECLAAIADRVAGCADDWPLLARLNFDFLQPDGARLVDPARLHTGWQLSLPSGAVERHQGGFDPGALDELGLLGLSVVSACVVARRVRTLRRAAAATRRADERRHHGERSTALAGAALAPFADAPLVDWIDGANRALWRAVRDAGGPAPDLRLVRAGPDGVEFLLASPLDEAPWPFRAERSGQWWRLDPSIELVELAAVGGGGGRFAPALVPVGDDELASYLVPVGRGRRLVVRGDDDHVDATIQAIVAALRTAPWAEELEVELVGITAPPPEEQCYQLASSAPSDLVRLGADRPAGDGSRLDVRWRREPLVVVARGALGPADERLLAAASDVAGVVVAGVDAAGVDARSERRCDILEVGPDGAVLLPYGVALSSVAPDAPQLALLEALLAEARRPPEPVPLRRPSGGVAPADEIAAAGPVELRLLRPEPELSGLAKGLFSRDAGRVVELVCYLCLHGGRAELGRVGEALFARSPEPSRTTRAENVAAAARQGLGSASGGRPLLARRGGELVLDTAVTCDWLRAEEALSRARLADGEDAERLCAAALGLVEGAPLSGVVAGYTWFAAEQLDEDVTCALADGAHRLACLALASGDAALARWAVERGRLADPDSELLARDLMAACDLDGDPAGVETTFSELEQALERLGGNEPSVETRALFEALERDR